MSFKTLLDFPFTIPDSPDNGKVFSELNVHSLLCCITVLRFQR